MIPARLTIVLAVSAGLGCLAGPGRADMIAACGAEIGSYCSDVSEGRGRIAACLVSHTEKLGASCRPEVQAMAQRAGSNRFMPASVRNLLVSRTETQLPASCGADVQRVCPQVQTGDSRIFACLYARMDRVSEACSAEAQQVMKQLN